MIHKSKAITLHTIRYGENSLIAYLYTEAYGRISLLVNGAFGKRKATGKAAFFQPLDINNVVFYHRSVHGLGRLKEVSTAIGFSSIPFDPVKRAIALFVSELVYRTVREEESNPVLYNFLETSIHLLDVMSTGAHNFHIIFLVQLSRHLGFYPGNRWSSATPYFDYRNGLFIEHEPQHPLFFGKSDSEWIGRAMDTPFHEADRLEMNHLLRKQLIENLLAYYQFHIESVAAMKSLPVLAQVFE
jgi:DNA repair protein RecO (recombination protein O)